MKIIRVTGGSSILEIGKEYCVGENEFTYEYDGHQFPWYMEDGCGVVYSSITLQEWQYVILAGTSDSGVIQALKEIKDAIFGSAGQGSGYDYQIQQAQERQARAAEDNERHQFDMSEFFREMTTNMRDDRYAKQNKEALEQQAQLDKQIQITPYTEEQKLYYYLHTGIERKLKVVYKKVS